MELISIIVGFGLGLIFFYLLNTWFEIWYFGCKAIVSTFMGCWIAGFLVVFLLFYVLKYVLIFFVVVAILVKIFHKKKPRENEREAGSPPPDDHRFE